MTSSRVRRTRVFYPDRFREVARCRSRSPRTEDAASPRGSRSSGSRCRRRCSGTRSPWDRPRRCPRRLRRTGSSAGRLLALEAGADVGCSRPALPSQSASSVQSQEQKPSPRLVETDGRRRHRAPHSRPGIVTGVVDLLPTAACRPGRTRGRGHTGSSSYSASGFSNTAAAPMPPPMHIETTPYFTPRRFISWSERGGQLGAGAAQRVAERDGAAVDVDLVDVDAELRGPSTRPGWRRPR